MTELYTNRKKQLNDRLNALSILLNELSAELVAKIRPIQDEVTKIQFELEQLEEPQA